MNCSLRSILVACFLSDSSCHHRAPCVGYLTRLIGPTMRCNKPTALALLLLLLLLLLRLSGRGSRTTVAVSPLHVTPRRTLPRSFRLSTPIDVSAATDAASLRRVARARAVDRGRGPELMLLATDACPHRTTQNHPGWGATYKNYRKKKRLTVAPPPLPPASRSPAAAGVLVDSLPLSRRAPAPPRSRLRPASS